MAVTEFLLAAARAWPQLASELREEQVGEIRRQLAAVVHGAEWSPSALLDALLSGRATDDPLWTALGERPTRAPAVAEGATAPPDITLAAIELRLAIERAVAEPGPALPADPDAAEAQAVQRLFTVPMREVEAQPESILVLPHHGHRYAPAFQFDERGQVLEAAAVVNRILDAHHDPWGAASWWLTPHATLAAIPADLVRVGDARDVMAAAKAAGR